MGSGPAKIEHYEIITLNAWNTVEVERFRKYGSITVNSKAAQKGVSHGNSITLNLGPELIIGGAATTQLPGKPTQPTLGFHGCVQELVVNGKSVDLVREFTRYDDVTNCHSSVSPCQPSPCQNNATCQVIHFE